MRRRSTAKGIEINVTPRVEPEKVVESIASEMAKVFETAVEKTKIAEKDSASESNDLPRFQMGTEKIVRSIFETPDVWPEYEELRAALKFDSSATAMSIGQIIDATESSNENAQRAVELLAIVKADHDDYEVQASMHVAAMREQAIQKLLEENDERKEKGQSTKRVNKDDVADVVSQMFPDEWSTIQSARARAKHAITVVESLVKQWNERQWNLRQILARFKGD